MPGHAPGKRRLMMDGSTTPTHEGRQGSGGYSPRVKAPQGFDSPPAANQAPMPGREGDERKMWFDILFPVLIICAAAIAVIDVIASEAAGPPSARRDQS
jgi:hypothetical protein